MQSKLVSIIVPTFKNLLYLKGALFSLIGQTYSNIEIILIDDNVDENYSNGVLQIVNDIKDKRIKYFKNFVNLGSAKSRNFGITKAIGYYVTFLDDDDYYLNEKIEKQVSIMDKLDLDFSFMNTILENKKKHLKIKKYPLKINYFNNKELLKFHIKFHITSPNTFMFNALFIRKINCFPEIDIGDDFFLMLNAIKKRGKFLYINETYVVARVHDYGTGLSLSEKKIKGQNQILKAKMKYKNLFRKNELSFILCRHNLVFAKIYFLKKDFYRFFSFLLKSFLLSPFSFFFLIIKGY